MKYLKLYEDYKVDNITENDIIKTIKNGGRIKISIINNLPTHNEDIYVKPLDIQDDIIIIDINGTQYNTKLEFVTKIEYK